MSKPIFRLPVLPRIYLVAIVAIVIPSLVLTYFGYQLIGEMRKLDDERRAKSLRDEVQLRIERIEQDVRDSEMRILNALNVDDTNELLRQVAGLEASENLVEQFFVLDYDGELIYPQPLRRAADDVTPQSWVVEDPKVEELRHLGRVEEFVNKDPEAALPHYVARYDQLAGQGTAPQTVAALIDVAGVHFKMKQYGEAAPNYRRVVDIGSAGGAEPSLVALARYQLSSSLLSQDKAMEAAEVILAFYEDLVYERTGLRDESRSQFFKERVMIELEILDSARQISAETAQRFHESRREDERRESKKAFLERLNTFIIARLKVEEPDSIPRPDYQSSGAARTGFRHFQDRIKDEYVSIAYAFYWPSERSGRPWVLGFKTDLDYVRDRVLSRFLLGASRGPREKICVLDRDGSVVFPVGEVLDVAQAGVVTHEFRDSLQFWRLGIVDLDPRSPHKQFYVVYIALNLLLFAIIVVGVILTIKDMTRELEISRLKSDFVSSVSHELKTPLALIRMFAETLQLGRLKDQAKVQEYYDVIARESERLTQLINNVLDFSRIESGRRTYEFEPTDVGELVFEAVESYRYELDQQKCCVDVSVEADLPDVPLDRTAVSQALLNLLNNAVKYSPDDKAFQIDVWRAGDDVLMAVTDHGLGIGPEDREKVFEVFYRSRDEAVRRTKGTGLGLALVKHAAEAHGGTVRVQSEQGVGSTFTIVLPLRRGK